MQAACWCSSSAAQHSQSRHARHTAAQSDRVKACEGGEGEIRPFGCIQCFTTTPVRQLQAAGSVQAQAGHRLHTPKEGEAALLACWGGHHQRLHMLQHLLTLCASRICCCLHHPRLCAAKDLPQGVLLRERSHPQQGGACAQQEGQAQP
jgi:hypothetical protein